MRHDRTGGPALPGLIWSGLILSWDVSAVEKYCNYYGSLGATRYELLRVHRILVMVVVSGEDSSFVD